MSHPNTSALEEYSPSFTSRESSLERVTMIHVASLLIMAAWAFGGNADWARIMIGCWASLSLPLFFNLVRDAASRRHSLPRLLHCLWPLLGFNLLVIISLFSPGFWVGTYEGETFYIKNDVSQFLPSSARPPLSLMALWVFDGIYLSCFNLLLAIKSRKAFRGLLLVLSANALALAIFGTLQKLVHAKGLYFGLQPSPQTKFFSSFIYHNHWGAFTVLMLVVGLGVFFHYLRRHDIRELMQTPAMLVAASSVLLAISVPLSGSRSASIMTLFLLLIAVFQWLRINSHRRQSRSGHRYGSLAAAILIMAVVIFAAYKLGEPVIRERLEETSNQITQAKVDDRLNQRMVLYQDTWNMAKDRLLFGWGMASYPNVFVLYNTQDKGAGDNLPHFYHDAHSDWLQSLAELGLVGTALIALCGLTPLWHFRHSLGRSPISNYLLLGTGMILLYAWVEFPFGNTAVVIAFWLCFFTALRYSQCDSNTHTKPITSHAE